MKRVGVDVHLKLVSDMFVMVDQQLTLRVWYLTHPPSLIE